MTRINIYKVLSVAAFGLMYFFTAVMILFGLPFIFMKRRKTVKFLMRIWAKTIFLIIGKRLHVQGLENIRNDLHFILVANHASLFDIIAIVSVIPDISWFGHERLLRIPVFRRVLILTDYIPMKKTSYRNTKEMVSLLKAKSEKQNIAIFPEGTRTLSGKVNDFYRGFILLLRASDIDVLPVTLNGFYALKPKNRSYIDFSAPLEVIIHQPMEREFLIRRTDREIADLIKEKIESATTYNVMISPPDNGEINPKFIKA